MPEYKLKFTEETTDDRRQETLNELISFMQELQGLTMTVVTLDEEQSENWDKEGDGDFDYQDYYGKQIIQQIKAFDQEAECVVIRNNQHLPVAMANKLSGWQSLGVEKRLRIEVSKMIGLDDYQLEAPRLI
jgi:hypothetical protein